MLGYLSLLILCNTRCVIMISIQLADLFQTYIGASEKPSSELIEKYGRATTAIANTFTIKVTEDDEKYLYLRYKKIKNDTSGCLSIIVSNLILQTFRHIGIHSTTLFDLLLLFLIVWI